MSYQDYEVRATFLSGETSDVDENTKLLLHFNNNFTDESDSKHTVINTDVIFDNITKKWGFSSACFNGITAYLTIANSTDWNIVGSNSDDWTIDFQVKKTDNDPPGEYYIQHY